MPILLVVDMIFIPDPDTQPFQLLIDRIFTNMTEHGTHGSELCCVVVRLCVVRCVWFVVCVRWSARLLVCVLLYVMG